MNILLHRACKNQIFVFFAIECVCDSILDGFCAQVEGNSGFQLEIRSNFESNCYKVYFLRGPKSFNNPLPHKNSLSGPSERDQGEPRTRKLPLIGSAGVFFFF